MASLERAAADWVLSLCSEARLNGKKTVASVFSSGKKMEKVCVKVILILSQRSKKHQTNSSGFPNKELVTTQI